MKEIKWLRGGSNDLSIWVSGSWFWKFRSLDALKLLFVSLPQTFIILSYLECISILGIFDNWLKHTSKYIIDWNTQVNILFIHQLVWSRLCFEVYKVWFLACNHRLSSLLPTLQHTNISSGTFILQPCPSMNTKETFLVWDYAAESQPLNYNSFSVSCAYLLPVSA